MKEQLCQNCSILLGGEISKILDICSSCQVELNIRRFDNKLSVSEARAIKQSGIVETAISNHERYKEVA